MSFGADKPAKARATIQAKGKLVTYEPVGTEFDPALLAVMGGTTSRQVRAVITDARARPREGTSFRTTRVFLVAALDIETVKRGDRFREGEQAWTVETIQTTYAGDYAVIHNCLAEAA